MLVQRSGKVGSSSTTFGQQGKHAGAELGGSIGGRESESFMDAPTRDVAFCVMRDMRARLRALSG